MAKHVILDCYTDEPSGLGVPPYVGTYPRYIYGKLKSDENTQVFYLTIDDLRLLKKYDSAEPQLNEKQKTKIDIYNLTKNSINTNQILEEADTIAVILGVHTPGKYLTAIPGTLREVEPMIANYNAVKILTGPAASVHGTQLEGGRFSEAPNQDIWAHIDKNYYNVETFNEIDKYAKLGAEVLSQMNNVENKIVELETGQGCYRDVGCSYCVEAQKPQSFRDQKPIIEEVKAL